MQFSSRRFADVIVAAPVGRIDHANAGAFEDALRPLLHEAGGIHQPLLLDFAGVEYISSIGLRVVMTTARQAGAQGSRVAVASLRPVVAEIFAISRFDRIFAVYPSLPDALAELSPSALAVFNVGKTRSAT